MLSKAEIRTIMDALMLKEIKVEPGPGGPVYQRVHFADRSDHAHLITKLSIMLEMME